MDAVRVGGHDVISTQSSKCQRARIPTCEGRRPDGVDCDDFSQTSTAPVSPPRRKLCTTIIPNFRRNASSTCERGQTEHTEHTIAEEPIGTSISVNLAHISGAISSTGVCSGETTILARPAPWGATMIEAVANICNWDGIVPSPTNSTTSKFEKLCLRASRTWPETREGRRLVLIRPCCAQRRTHQHAPTPVQASRFCLMFSSRQYKHWRRQSRQTHPRLDKTFVPRHCSLSPASSP